MTKRYSKYFLLFVSSFCFFYSTGYSQSGLVETIYFKSDSYSIDKKYYITLDLVAKQLRSDTFSFLKVFGYTDTTGSDEYNYILSGKRANAVYDYLARKVNIDTTKLYVTWIGKSGQDVAYDLHFPSANIQKRCVDIWVSFFRKLKVDKPK